MTAETRSPTPADRILGCMLGGAAGDAMGASTEFMTLRYIRRKFPPDGVTGYEKAYGRRGAITDDTQMSLFTAEGLLVAAAAATGRESPIAETAAIREAYLRWFDTQEPPHRADGPAAYSSDGVDWLLSEERLHSRRAPGHTCLGSLRAGGHGTPEVRVNDSKGCGGVMRVAPVGLVSDRPFRIGCESAAITHGHPTGFLSAGAFAVMIARLMAGESLQEAVEASLGELSASDAFSGEEIRETREAIEQAVDLAGSEAATPETVQRLGQGWIAEEAAAIGVFCALKAAEGDSQGPDARRERFRRGVLLAVNHSGDTDSTGSLTGNLLGTLWGVDCIPEEWLADLELADVIRRVAEELAAEFVG